MCPHTCWVLTLIVSDGNKLIYMWWRNSLFKENLSVQVSQLQQFGASIDPGQKPPGVGGCLASVRCNYQQLPANWGQVLADQFVRVASGGRSFRGRVWVWLLAETMKSDFMTSCFAGRCFLLFTVLTSCWTVWFHIYMINTKSGSSQFNRNAN